MNRFNRAVTIKCSVCGLEVTGVVDANGVVHASDRSRPADDKVQVGICVSCSDRRQAYKPLADPAGLEWDH
jgi:hypothetical protein